MSSPYCRNYEGNNGTAVPDGGQNMQVTTFVLVQKTVGVTDVAKSTQTTITLPTCENVL